MPSLGTRLALAWRVLVDAAFAARTARSRLAAEPDQPSSAPPTPAFSEASPDAALQLLALMQQHGRLVDFLKEDVSGYSDAEIGSAARVVHQGCRKALDEHLSIVPVSDREEGARLTLEAGFDAASYRLTGKVVGQAPFTGTLAHRGWRVSEISLPKLSKDHDTRVLAPAEVEL